MIEHVGGSVSSRRVPPLDLQTLIPALKVIALMRHGAEMTRMQLDLL
jgi:hypothetical protein